MTERTIEAIVEEIFSLYETHGGEEYAGEKVTQLEHMCQSAQLAEEGEYYEEMILAAFLHDIGHICVSSFGENGMNGYGTMNHEKVGGDFLKARGFSPRLIKLVQGHVDAKRYLTWKYPEYYEQLSEASKITLSYQGGKMEEQEALLFEKDMLFPMMIEMRRIDEAAKELKKPLPDLEKYKAMMTAYLQRQSKEKVVFY
ncbi:MAG: HD domain-containing protein [Sphingobacteriales bacterium]|nr:HD domain-containing protein [Sphingobacteriales bacterium]